MEKPVELWRRVRRLFTRGAVESGLDEEIAFHIEQQTQKNVRTGMTPEEARRAALVRFGGVERTRERTRDEYRPIVLDDLVRDIRYGVRSLLRAPGFAFTSILTLGLGIGAAVAVFSMVNGILLKALPYPESDRIVRLLQVSEKGEKGARVSEPNFKDWQAESRSFSAMAEMAPQGLVSVHGSIAPNRATMSLVSRDFFDVMQVHPAIGRGFAEDELHVGATPTLIVSDAYARRWFGDARSALNATLTSGPLTATIIGVMPAGFDYPAKTELWFPRELEEPSTSRTAHNFQVVARLTPGITLEQAQRDISTISRAMKARYGEETWMSDGAVVSLRDQMTQYIRPTLYLLISAAALLFVITCANVSNLLLARAATRRRELAVRLAIGAGRTHIVRQLFCESLVLCTAGGAVGVLIAYAGVKGLLAIDPGNLPRADEIAVDWTVLAFAFAVSTITALVLGLVTTLRVGQRDLRSSFVEDQRTMAGGRHAQRVRDGLVVAQIALTLVLLTGAGLLTRSFLGLLAVDTGFRTDDALVLDIALPTGNETHLTRNADFRDRLLAQLESLPGVTGVGLINDFPLGGAWYANGTFIEMTRPDEVTTPEDFGRVMQTAKERTGTAGYRVASEDYFRAMGIPLIHGRLFEDRDGPDATHVAVISKSLADRKWPNQNPIGRLIQFGNMDGDLRPLHIVGIVGDVREISPENVPAPLLYTNHRQRRSANQFSVIVRGPKPAAIASTAQRIVRELDPQVPVNVRTVEQALEQSMAGRRFSLVLLGVFAVAALTLATLGIYGVISYLVAQRTREIGIRMALGADRRDVMRMIVGKGAALAGIGGAIGLAAALVFTRVLQGMLFNVKATDPISFAVVLATVGSAVLLASYIPARRASRVAPSLTLRD